MGPNISSPDDTQAVLDAIRRIVQVLRESSRAAEHAVGLSGAQLFVLRTLGDAPALSLNALAALTRTHQSSVSTVVARLVACGYVKRGRSAVDARTLELSLTADGRRLIARAPHAAQDRLIVAIDSLAAGARRTLAGTLSRLTHQMDVADGTPAMFFEERHPRKRRSATSRRAAK